METKTFYVAKAYGSTFSPAIMERFENLKDAECYAALMCRVKKARYIVLEQQAEWDGTTQENA